MKKNPQIGAVVSSLQSIVDNIAKAPDRWWEGNNNSKKSAIQFEEEDEVVDFEQMMGDNTTLTKLEDGKRKRSEDEEDGDASSTTESIDIAEATAQAKVAHDNTPIAKQNTTIDQSLFDTVEKAKLDQSCALPSNFSQEYSPITIKGSQLSDGTLELNVSMPTSDGQKTATASQIEGVMQSLESESQKKKSTFASSENNKTATPPKPK
eukprot:scaffold859_cov190-Alexandrium_tamarense.AAC.26